MTAAERKKMEEAKARAKEKAADAATKKQAGRRGEIGEFGYGTNSRMTLFCQSISKAAKTMEQIQKEKWNTKGAIFNRRFRELVKDSKAAKTADGKMFIIGSAADPNNKKKAAPKKKK